MFQDNLKYQGSFKKSVQSLGYYPSEQIPVQSQRKKDESSGEVSLLGIVAIFRV